MSIQAFFRSFSHKYCLGPHSQFSASILVTTMESLYCHPLIIIPGRKIHLSNQFVYATSCSFPMLLSLLAGIKRITMKQAQTRATDSLSGNEHFVKLHKNYTTNTLEQFVVGLTLMLIIAAYTDNLQVLRLLSVYSFVFIFG